MNIQDNINQLFQQQSFKDLLNDKDYRMQKLLDVYDSFKQYDISPFKQELNTMLEDLLPRTKFTFQDYLNKYQNNLPIQNFLMLIGKIAAYVDFQAYNKNIWNEYTPPRSLVRSRFDMRQWLVYLIKHKLNQLTFDIPNAYTNSIIYVEQPNDCIPIMSENHKKLISEKVLATNYQHNSFPNQIKTWLRNKVTFTLSNPLNESLLVKDLLYNAAIKPFWQEGSAIEIEDIIEIETEVIKPINNMLPSLNQILYGPPGTGKTYNTINKAVEIIDPVFFAENKQNRAAIMQKFNNSLIKDFEKTDGQVAFCTFHQSMSYEDFIEGIKPKMNTDKADSLQYEIKDGIFKVIARMAKESTEQIKPEVVNNFSINSEELDKAIFYKMSLGNTQIADDNEIYDYCIANNYVALGWGGEMNYTGLTSEDIYKKAKDAGQSSFSAQQVNMFWTIV